VRAIDKCGKELYCVANVTRPLVWYSLMHDPVSVALAYPICLIPPVLRVPMLAVFLLSAEQGDNVLNILTAVVFGFSGLNILNLVSRRFDPRRRSMSFGEITAIGVMVLALCILAWELLHLFHVFPIKLRV